MKKRGQATVFIILGIVVLTLFGLLLALRGDLLSGIFNTGQSDQSRAANIEPVKEVIANCVEITLLDGVEWVSNRGGYFEPVDSEQYSYDSGDILVAYAWGSEIGTRLPTLDGLGIQINLYMAEHRAEIEDCIDKNLEQYQRIWSIRNEKDFSLGIPQITDNTITQRILFNNPLSVSKGDYVGTSNEILAELDLALGQAHKMAVEISSCFNGDSLPADFNTYCNNGGVPFRAELYNMKYPNNVVRMLHQACAQCSDCYHLYIPAEGGDIIFNTDLATC
nr:hypothetical protein [Nanoarchaeum sp.]